MENKWRMKVVAFENHEGDVTVCGQLKAIGDNLSATIAVKEGTAYEISFRSEDTYETFNFGDSDPIVVHDLSLDKEIECWGRFAEGACQGKTGRLCIRASRVGIRVSYGVNGVNHGVFHFPIPMGAFLWLCAEVNDMAVQRLGDSAFHEVFCDMEV